MQKLSSPCKTTYFFPFHGQFQGQNEFKETCKDDENIGVSIAKTLYIILSITITISFVSCWVYNFFKRHPLGKKLLGKIGRVSSEEPPNTQITVTSTHGDPSDNKQNGGLVGDYGGGVYGANFSGGNYGVYEAGRGTTRNDGHFGGRY